MARQKRFFVFNEIEIYHHDVCGVQPFRQLLGTRQAIGRVLFISPGGSKKLHPEPYGNFFPGLGFKRMGAAKVLGFPSEGPSQQVWCKSDVPSENRGLVIMKTTAFSRFTSLDKFGILACLASVLVLFAPPARADDEDATKDPPKRVARLSLVDGSVSMQPGGQGDWGNAVRNRPVTIADKIWVDKDSRAELQAGEATFHLGSMTAFSFLNLDEGITQVRIPEGAVNFRVRELRQGDIYEVDTPNVVFIVKGAGAFRVDINEAGDSSRITVIRGQGEITADRKTYEVHAGEQAEFSGAENPNYSIGRAPGPDGLDRWAEERDLKEDRSTSGNYVSRDMPGYDDLDENGTWRDEREYGHVWYPNDVGPDWAPYSDGNWAWVAPWGWTWVGYEPWGFAPYHYGRWAFIGGAWGWCPGPYFGPPCYGPAFVGFLGGGWGFGFGFGVGWFPLGWGEPFFPWFPCSHTFVNVINVHNTFINNVNVLNGNGRNINFVNAHNLRAVTVASRNAFVGGQPINRGAQRITQASLNNAKVTTSVGIRPTQHSALGSANINPRAPRPPAGVQNRTVMARTAPAAAASHLPVQRLNGSSSADRFGNAPIHGSARTNAGVESRPGNAQANSGMTARQRELSQNRPPSATPNRPVNGPAGNNSSRPGNNSRTWEAQSNTTDGGRAPQGFGSNRPSNPPAQNSPRSMGDRSTQAGGGSNAPAHDRVMSDRPPWAGSGAPSSNGVPAVPHNTNPPNYSNGGRSYSPQRSYSSPSEGNRGYAQQPSYTPRTYSSPGRSYPAPSRSYSPPSRSYSAPSRSYSAPPSRSYGGGGGSYHGGGGGGFHGGAGGGGGGHASSGGGGGHASSGGGGGSHGGGGGHPHR